ncbi:MAG: HlyD family efflux transporter periplasmic adaptor subunit [Firmicutes bacterium]|nr:HlyD family efflux transporter periplasmic adaptor subunit [Bacillota bacterium]
MKTNRILKSLLIIALSVMLIIYTTVQLLTTFSTNVEYESAGLATIEEKLELKGYIMRNEKVLTSAASGVTYYIVDEGEKVAVKTPVAQIYASVDQLDLKSRISVIDKKISLLQNSEVDQSYLTADISKIDEKIEKGLTELKSSIINNQLTLTLQKKSTLLTQINRRLLMTSAGSNYEARIAELQSEKARLTKQLTSILETTYAPMPGYFSADVDGYEEAFSIDKLDTLDLAAFDEMTASEKADTTNAVGKIITDYNWYALCPTDKYSASEFDVGATYSLRFPFSSDAKFDATLYKKIASTDSDEVVLVFSTNYMTEDFNYVREQTVEVIRNEYTGLRILKTALRKIDDTEGVYVLQGNTVVFKKVDRIYENEGYYLVDTKSPGEEGASKYLSMYDSVITGGKNLYEGKIIE